VAFYFFQNKTVMKNKLMLLATMLVSAGVLAQTTRNQYLGVNILELPASTINVNYSVDLVPCFTPMVEMGYTFNHVKAENTDIPGWYLTSHYKEGFSKTIPWVAYSADVQSGGYLKLGGSFNLRNNFERQAFFHIGLFLTNSLVYESGWEQKMYPVTYEPTPINHTVFLVGLSCLAGYTFSISDRLKSDVDFQVSFPDKKYRDLYGYRNFIPGMGFKDNEKRWFPMLIWNLKYRL
jgi:hypothetical protein